VTFDDVTSGEKAPLGRVLRNFRLRMRTTHPSKGTPSGSCEAWWRHFRWNGPTRADIAQLPVAHAHTPPFQGNPFGVTSHPVAMLLPVMRNGTFCTTTIVRKSEGTCCACARDHFRSRDLCYFRLRDFRWHHFMSGSLPVTSLPVAPHRSISNEALAVLIYYSHGSIYSSISFKRIRCVVVVIYLYLPLPVAIANKAASHVSWDFPYAIFFKYILSFSSRSSEVLSEYSNFSLQKSYIHDKNELLRRTTLQVTHS
jgi:hypothetical protein